MLHTSSPPLDPLFSWVVLGMWCVPGALAKTLLSDWGQPEVSPLSNGNMSRLASFWSICFSPFLNVFTYRLDQLSH